MESKFTGGVLGLIGISLLECLIIFVTLGIATPWATCVSERWKAEHTIIDGKQLVFDGKGKELFGKWILWLLLSVVTLGIYALWATIKLHAWLVAHTHTVDNAVFAEA